MGFSSANDFFALLRGNASGSQDVLRMPMIDAICQVLADMGAITLVAGPSQPPSNQTTTAWLQTNNPSYNAQGTLFLWNGNKYIAATPQLFVDFLLASSVTISTMNAAIVAATATANAALAATGVPATTAALGLVREATIGEMQAGVTSGGVTPAAGSPEGVAAAITAQTAAALAANPATTAARGALRLATTAEAQAGLTTGSAPAAMSPEDVAAAIGALVPSLQSQGVPQGRLTLTSGLPVLSAAVIAATSVFFTPNEGNIIGLWNGVRFIPTPFPELTAPLNDATVSPAAALAASFYDLFVWNNAGVVTLSRGPAWTNGTTRGYNLNRVSGTLVNASAISNGPGVGYGTFVGTIMTDPAAATVSFNPQPAAASGGPATASTFTGGSIGLWNNQKRKEVSVVVQDSKATWSPNNGSWGSSDASTKNRFTNVVGQAEDSVRLIFAQGILGRQAQQSNVGIGVNSTTVASGVVGSGPNTGNSAVSATGNAVARLDIAPAIGQSYYQAIDYSSAGTETFYGGSTTSGATGQSHQLSGQVWF